MSRSAKVTSIDAIREFQNALRRYQEALQDICEAWNLETHKAHDWIEQDRARYWPHAWKHAENRLVAAQNDLQLAKLAAMQNEHKSCIDEQKAVERATARQRQCEEKMRLLKHWRSRMRHETEEFRGKLARLRQYNEVDIPRALAGLDRVLQALEKYTDKFSASARPGRLVLDTADDPVSETPLPADPQQAVDADAVDQSTAGKHDE